MKRCSKCHVEKPLDEFNYDKNGKFQRKAYCKVCVSIYNADKYKENYDPIVSRERNIKNKYNISLEEYNILFEKQKGFCAICYRHQTEFKRRLAVDHSHSTGEVRSLLCNNCNTALGLMNEDVNRLQSAINYLRNKNKPSK